MELAAVTRADDTLISAIAGTSVRLAPLLADVPLARRGADGAWELHDVIASALLEHEDRDRVAEIRRVAGAHLRAAGDLDGAIRLLGAAGDRDATVAVLRDQFVQMGSQEEPSLAARWIVLLDPAVLDEPEALLAQSVAAMLVDPERAFVLGAPRVDEFRARDDVDGETAALSLLGGIAYTLVDASRMVPYVARIAELAATGHRWARALDAMCIGAFALLVGDWERAHEVLLPVVTDPAGDASQGNAGFLCARAMLEGGRLQDAAVLIGRMAPADRARVRDGILGVEVAIAQGLGADTEVMEELRAVTESRVDRRPAVARRVARCRLAEGLAIAGDVPGARRHLAELDLLGPTMDATRDDELFSSAVVAVAAGDEPTAAELLAQIPDRGAFFPPFHGLVLFYVLRPELRGRYADRRPEGVHAQRCAFAAAFVAARAGETELLARYPWPRADVVRWFAPAAWLVEAMVRTTAAGGTPPADLWATLAPTQRTVLRRLADDAEPAVAAAAARADEALGPAAPGRLVIRVLGELELEFDGVVVGGPELRRERVRALLALLVLRRSVRRADAAATLWPDLDDDAALGNLRVTLTHLLKLIEPRRDRNAPSYFVRQDRDRLCLPTDPALEVDVWEFEAAIERAARAEQMSAPVAVVDALGPAVERWRGDPFADLGSYEWLDFERLRLGTQYVRAALRLGDLCVADHDADRAELMARRAIAADPWCEAAYRLLASAHTERGDSSGARQVLSHLNDLLAELELTPEPATVALLEQFHLAR